ncbi:MULTISPECIES: hypothetical protein [unclassified Flavobacterium]|uniref:hypothetical protein n=1 Tax=unclassified Flavobacterium TaxID=196869 RepID=UPI001F1477BC|nr:MULTISPECIES: hypothetical protein [unclassified Flavobacterium]UMY66766.1 hypothetical protein MKO97_05120 [Flavobacterium sp. HJ-32-4]
MRKIVFSLLAILYFGFNGYSQDRAEGDLTPLVVMENSNEASLKLSCTKVNVGLNILIAWVSADVYIACGFPPNQAYPTGCMPVSEKMCKAIEDMQPQKTNYALNIKDFFKDVDIRKVTELEITKSDQWLDDSGETVTIRLGKYPVDPEGYFNLEIVKTR